MNEYIAFISYRHMPLDIAVAKRLHQLIERYHIPARLAAERGSRRLGRVFRDQDELPLSSDLSASIYEALDHTQFLIVVCTPETPKSIWVQREISYFLEHHDRDNVLVVLADGRPEESFPDQLVHIYDADGNLVGNTEPLAANIVGGNTREVLRKLNDEKLRLFAALIGCSYDALFQREKRYRARRLAAALSVVAVAASAFIGMLLVKNGQITAQNQALVEQKERIQLSESTLLTQNAQASLASDDPAGAVRSAVAALPESAGDSRPYYAPAERVLLDALHVYDLNTTPVTFIAETEISIPSPVADCAVNQAGDRLFAADDYGDVFAFDPVTGEALWRSTGDSIAYSASDSSTRLLLTEDGVIDACRTSITCLKQDTGEVMWRYAIDILFPAPIVLSKDKSRLAVVNNAYYTEGINSDNNRRDYWIDLLDTKTGKVARTVPLASVSSDLSHTFEVPIYTKAHGALGDAQFFDGDSKLVGYYFFNDALNVYVADLESGDCRTLQTWEAARYSEPVIGVCVDAQGKNVYVFQRSKDCSIGATCVRIDLESGEELWRTQTPMADKSYYFDSFNEEDSCLLKSSRQLFLSVKDQLYVLNMENGETTASSGLLDDMVELYPIENTSLFGFVLKNGYYAVGWLNDNGLFDSRGVFNAAFNLGSLNRAAQMKQGFMRPMIDGSSINGFEVGDMEEGFGAIVVVPRDNDHALRVKSLLPFDNVTEQESISFPGASDTLESGDVPGMMFVEGGALLRSYAYGDDGKINHCVKLDTRTRQMTEMPDYKYDGYGRVFPLTDGTGYIWLDYGVAVHYFAFDGSVDTVLAKEKELEVHPNDNFTLRYSASDGDAEYLDGGQLLTAHCDGEKLRWWLDTEAQGEASLPPHTRWATRSTGELWMFTRVGGNGLVVLSSYGPDVRRNTIDSFIAYDTRTGRWTTTPDDQHGASDRNMAIGAKKPLLAVMDADRSLRVYDLQAGQLWTTLPLDLPPDYVLDMRFAFGDDYLVLRMDDQQLAIFSLESGECVYRGSLEQSFRINTLINEDKAGHRAYIIDQNSKHGLVLDRQSWEPLAELENVYGFDTELDELYFFSYSNGLIIRKIPDLQALVQMGRKVADVK